MSFKKPILVILSLIILCVISSPADANTRWNLLEGYVYNPSEFKEFEIGKKIVYWHQRKLGEAIVELNYIVYHFDRESHELIDVISHWREDLLPFLPELNITKEQTESMVEGMVQFSQLYIISPESFIFSPIKPTPENPCWVVVSTDETKGLLLTVIDAVDGTVLGYGIAPPYTAFSLTGPEKDDPCRNPWTLMYENAQYWFDKMGYFTEAVEYPTEEKVKSHIESKATAMFYEIAHSLGQSDRFASGCDGGFYEITYASEIEDWISDYTKMPFTFLASCVAMCDTSDGTLSYEFRKGSMEDTATVGYCHMDLQPCFGSCWPFALLWQTKLFECMKDGYTVKEAFDAANELYGGCYQHDCIRFAGDENFAVVPVVFRVYDPNSHWKLDETSGTIAVDSVGDNDGTLNNFPVDDSQWDTGKIDGALKFDGVDDYVSLYPISSLGGNTVTIVAWIEPNDVSEGLHPIVTQYRHDGGYYYGYYFYVGDDKPKFYLGGAGSAQSLDSINTGEWYHLAGTNDGSYLRIYVNGELKGTQSSSGYTGANLDTYIGYDDDGDGSYFDGKIDDVRVYNYALDMFEIWDAMSGDLPRFRIKNSSDETVAWFDTSGNLFLKGSKHIEVEWVEPSGANDEFIFEDSSGPIVYINESGDLFLKKGDVIAGAPPVHDPGSDEFRVQNSEGEDVAIINANDGHVYLKGELYENPEQ